MVSCVGAYNLRNLHYDLRVAGYWGASLSSPTVARTTQIFVHGQALELLDVMTIHVAHCICALDFWLSEVNL